jgi:hypothetical protein
MRPDKHGWDIETLPTERGRERSRPNLNLSWQMRGPAYSTGIIWNYAGLFKVKIKRNTEHP